MTILDLVHIIKGVLTLAVAGCVLATTNGWLDRKEG